MTFDSRSYERISTAIDYYVSAGYVWIDTPWLVSEKATRATYDGSRIRETTEGGILVGSAEQGFVELMLNGTLRPGHYVSAGPCFRFGDANRSPFHYPYFLKVELINVGSLDHSRLLNDAKRYMGGEIVETSSGHDILINGIEVGSYGSRSVNGHEWAFGTGFAEPRYTQAFKRNDRVMTLHSDELMNFGGRFPRL